MHSTLTEIMNQKIILRTRVKILDSLVRSRLTYSCPVWTTTAVQQSKICSAYTTMLRKVVINARQIYGMPYGTPATAVVFNIFPYSVLAVATASIVAQLVGCPV